MEIPPQPYVEAILSRKNSPDEKSKQGMYVVANGFDKKTRKKYELITTSFENETEQEIRNVE